MRVFENGVLREDIPLSFIDPGNSDAAVLARNPGAKIRRYRVGGRSMRTVVQSSGLALLFASGEQGAWYDPSDAETLWQDVAGTQRANVGDPVGRIDDKSGNDNHALQATAAARPILGEDGEGNRYLEFDGVNDFLASGDVDFSASDELTMAAALSLTTDVVSGIISLSDPSDTNYSMALHRTGSTAFRARSKGNSIGLAVSPSEAFSSGVVTGQSKLGAPLVSVQVDQGAVTESTAAQGGGTYGSFPIYLGALRLGTSSFLHGRIYGAVMRGSLTSGEDLTTLQELLAATQ